MMFLTSSNYLTVSLVLQALFIKVVSAVGSDTLALIIGCTVGGFVVLVLLIVLICLVIRIKRRRASHKSDQSPKEITHNGSHANGYGSQSPKVGSGIGQPTESVISTGSLPQGVWSSNPVMMAGAPARAYQINAPEKHRRYQGHENGQYTPRLPEDISAERSWFSRNLKTVKKQLPIVFPISRAYKKTSVGSEHNSSSSRPTTKGVDREHSKRLPRTDEPPSSASQEYLDTHKLIGKRSPASTVEDRTDGHVAKAFNFYFPDTTAESLPEKGSARGYSTGNYPATLKKIPEVADYDTNQNESDAQNPPKRDSKENRKPKKGKEVPSNMIQSDISLYKTSYQVSRTSSNVSKQSLPTQGVHQIPPAYGKGVAIRGNQFGQVHTQSMDRLNYGQGKAKFPSSADPLTGVTFAPDGTLIPPTKYALPMKSPTMFVAKPFDVIIMPNEKIPSETGVKVRTTTEPNIPPPDYPVKAPPAVKPKPKPARDEPAQLSQSQPSVFFKQKEPADQEDISPVYAVPTKKASRSGQPAPNPPSPVRPRKEEYAKQPPLAPAPTVQPYTREPAGLHPGQPNPVYTRVSHPPSPDRIRPKSIDVKAPISVVKIPLVEGQVSWEEVPGQNEGPYSTDHDAEVHVVDEAFKFLRSIQMDGASSCQTADTIRARNVAEEAFKFLDNYEDGMTLDDE